MHYSFKNPQKFFFFEILLKFNEIILLFLLYNRGLSALTLKVLNLLGICSFFCE